MSGSRILIVNADDFGRSPGINKGIIKAHHDGVVTSTTLMVNLPWAEDAVRKAASAPALAVGLHLNFCYAAPVASPADVPSLVDDRGMFVTSTAELIDQARQGDIRREAVAQLDLFQSLVGRLPSHIDSHKYLHSFEPFTSVVADLAASVSRPVRATSPEVRLTLRRAGVATTDHFEGRFHGLDGLGVSARVFRQGVEELQPGTTELMCHPGIVDDHTLDSSYTADRERELAVLCSAETADVVARGHVHLATYYDLEKGHLVDGNEVTDHD